jgi:hypothetical protein
MASLAKNDRVRDCAAITAAALLAVAVLRPFQDTPFVDDWAYAISVEQLIATGRLELLDFSAHLNVAQLLWGWLFTALFGFSFVALRWSTWTLAIAALCGTYLLLRQLAVGRREALLGTATFAVYPIFGILGASFMSDVPFVSFTVIGSYAMIRAARAHSTRWLIAAVFFASLAAATRAVGVVMPLAMAATLLCSRDPWGRQRGRWAICLFPLVMFGGLTLWARAHTRHIADLTWITNSTTKRLSDLQFTLQTLPKMLLETSALLIGWLGLALLPLTLAACRRQLLRRTGAIALGLAVGFGALLLMGARFTLPLEEGAMWRFDGIGFAPLLVPFYAAAATPPWIPWAALTLAVGSASAALAVIFTGRRWTPGEPFLIWMVLGHAGLMVVLWLINDRYVLVLVPIAVALVLAARPPLDLRIAGAVLLLFAAISVAGLVDHLRYNEALWTAVSHLDRRGIPASDVDGGYMVNGWRQYAHPEHAPRDARGAVNVPWVNGDADLPYAVANSAPPGWTTVERIPYQRLLGPAGHIYVLQRDQAAKADLSRR